MRPHNHRTEEEPPTPTQQPTPPATTHTRACHAWERGRKGLRDVLTKGRTEHWNLEAGGWSGKRPCKWTTRGPNAAVGERYLTAGLGWPLGRTWPTVTAIAFPCVDSTQRGETGQVWGLRWHYYRPSKRKGKEW